MARIRNLKPSFFTSEHVADLSPWARLLFAGLWTVADRDGRLEDRPRKIKAEVFPHDSIDVVPLLEELAAGADPFIVRYEVEGKAYIQILSFLKHQNPHHKEALSEIPAFLGVKTQSRGNTRQDRDEPRKEQDEPRKGSDEPGGLWVMGYGSGDGSGSGSEASAAQPAADAITPRQTVARFPQRATRKHGLSGGVHPGCDDATWGACARGICVPPFVAKAWRDQLGHGPETRETIAAFVDGVMARIPEGEPIGDEPVKFWRGQWAAKHGTAVPARQGTTKSDVTRDNARAVLDSLVARGIVQ